MAGSSTEDLSPNLPEDILLLIISQLEAQDLRTCEKTSTLLRRLVKDTYVKESLLLQKSPVPFTPHRSSSEALHLLREHERAWSSFVPKRISNLVCVDGHLDTSIVFKDYLYFTQSSAQDFEWVSISRLHLKTHIRQMDWLKLPKNLLHEPMFLPFTIDEEQDLLVCARENTTETPNNEDREMNTLTLFFFVASTGSPYPGIDKHEVDLDMKPYLPPALSVSGDFVCFMARIHFGWDEFAIVLVNWKNGSHILIPQPFIYHEDQSFLPEAAFLSPATLLTIRQQRLQFFDLSTPPPVFRNPQLDLGLPPLHKDFTYTRITFPYGQFTSLSFLESPSKPEAVDARVVIITLDIQIWDEERTWLLLIDRTSLLSLVAENPYVRRFDWDAWSTKVSVTLAPYPRSAPPSRYVSVGRRLIAYGNEMHNNVTILEVGTKASSTAFSPSSFKNITSYSDPMINIREADGEIQPFPKGTYMPMHVPFSYRFLYHRFPTLVNYTFSDEDGDWGVILSDRYIITFWVEFDFEFESPSVEPTNLSIYELY